MSIRALRKFSWLPLGASLLAGGAVATAPASAQAAPVKLFPEELTKVFDFFKQAVTPFQIVGSIQGVLKQLGVFGEAPDLVAKLDQVQARLLEEIQFYARAEIDGKVKEAFEKYRILLQNPGQMTANRNIILFLSGRSSSTDALAVYFELQNLILDGQDAELSAELLVSLNTLTMMMGDAMVLYEEAFNEAPTAWTSFNDHYGRTFRANYEIIKASRVQCHPGFNPGLSGVVAQHDNVFRTSRLYLKRSNKDFVVGRATCSFNQRDLVFNPVRDTFPPAAFVCPNRGNSLLNVVINGTTFGSLSSAAKAAARPIANDLADRQFRTDPLVSHLRDSIREYRFMSGGDHIGAPGDLNAAQFFDPWVDEPEVCPANDPWAYTQRP